MDVGCNEFFDSALELCCLQAIFHFFRSHRAFQPQYCVQMKCASTLCLDGANISVHRSKYPTLSLNRAVSSVSFDAKQGFEDSVDDEVEKGSGCERVGSDSSSRRSFDVTRKCVQIDVTPA